MNEQDFYVGYSPSAPRSLGRFVRLIAGLAVVIAIATALALTAAQNGFAPSRYEFGQYRDWSGVVTVDPAPLLIDGPRAYLLVGPGKHGVTDTLRGRHGRHVELRGSLAEHGPDALIEVASHPIGVGAASPLPERVALGPVILKGEIVDSKCYLGVMNPGQGKVHRDCAVRCISGGIPPALLVRDGKGNSRLVLLSGPDLNKRVLPVVAEPVTVSGKLFRLSGKTILEVTSIRR